MPKPALLASMLAVTLVACNGDFNKPALLDQPRILAVRAEPPQPSYGAPTTLSTLLYQPSIERVTQQCPNPGATTYAWSWCPWPVSVGTDANGNADVSCPIDDTQLAALYAALGLGAAPSLDLGQGESATFTNPFPAPLLYALCRGDIATTLGGFGGNGMPDAGGGRSVFACDMPASDVAAGIDVKQTSLTHPIAFKVTIIVKVTPACPSLLPPGFSPLIATYTLHLPTQDDIPLNQNPSLDGIFVTDNWTAPDAGAATDDGGVPADDGGISADDGGVPADDGGASPALDGGAGPEGVSGIATPAGAVPLAEEPSVTVARNVHVGLQLDTTIDSAEHLAVPSTIDYDSKAKLTRHYEHLTFSWYAEGGDFTGRGKGRNTGYLATAWPDGVDNPPGPDDLTSFAFNTTNTWDLPKIEDYPYATARIIIVVRDERGGVAWTSKQVSLEDHP